MYLLWSYSDENSDVGVDWNMTGLFFHSVGNNAPSWLSYFSEDWNHQPGKDPVYSSWKQLVMHEQSNFWNSSWSNIMNEWGMSYEHWFWWTTEKLGFMRQAIQWLGWSVKRSVWGIHLPHIFPLQWGAKELLRVSQPSNSRSAGFCLQYLLRLAIVFWYWISLLSQWDKMNFNSS